MSTVAADWIRVGGGKEDTDKPCRAYACWRFTQFYFGGISEEYIAYDNWWRLFLTSGMSSAPGDWYVLGIETTNHLKMALLDGQHPPLQVW